jgi:hypothetical protein
VIWCCLCIICSPELPCFMQVGNKPKSGAISLFKRHTISQLSYAKGRDIVTDVANEPVLQTVNTFRPSPDPPLPFTSSANQSPPHFAIALLRPTSSAAICLPSSIKSSAIARASFSSLRDDWRVRARRRVAAPRLTAVGRAVNRKSRIGVTWAASDSGEERNSGEGS